MRSNLESQTHLSAESIEKMIQGLIDSPGCVVFAGLKEALSKYAVGN